MEEAMCRMSSGCSADLCGSNLCQASAGMQDGWSEKSEREFLPEMKNCTVLHVAMCGQKTAKYKYST
jgi:hypothetical protein